MKSLSIACGFLFVCGMAAAAQAQVAATYLPPTTVAYAAPPIIVAPPPPVATYYSAPLYAPVVYPRRYVVPAPVVVRPRVYAVRPKVYVRGQPMRNAFRAVTP
ncbi:MAG TPA: hypothetical protein VGN42_20245 [Pirellulales bacterium]|jgi:hypothetical protein|nr:hypothetical protein [Pirellulales bacterium]